ncbi:hypothetical protein Cni_G11503 [Canna indica]|uniref:Sulfotransferase n=1 Tax=Canna indica TaxID=4628 RepID=A0AAQ3K6R5_9LILI|nr:hypothetical protein Cni_G11503 [Canna indica]
MELMVDAFMASLQHPRMLFSSSSSTFSSSSSSFRARESISFPCTRCHPPYQKPNLLSLNPNPHCFSISSSPTPPVVTTTTGTTLPSSTAPVLKKRTRYRKQYPGEKEGIVQEMRFVAMRLRNDSGGGEEQGEGETGRDGGKTWQPSMEGFLKYLVDSKLVFETIERIVDESTDVAHVYFRKTGLERASSLSKDLEWFSQNHIFIPRPSNPGTAYATYLSNLAEKSVPSFLCHFYNIYFAHITGGQAIGKKVSSMLLEGREPEFYRWDSDAHELLKNVQQNLNNLGEDTFVIKPPKKSHLALRMFVLIAVMICGVYICSVCVKQIGNQNMPRVVKFELTEESCSSPGIPPSESSYVHYPKPTTYSREECACTPVRFFAILSMQRSGSGWFETLLNSHVNTSSNGEIFSVKERRSNMSSIVRTLDKVYNLDWYSSASKNECTAAVGFKWMLNQGLMANHEEIVKYFDERGVYAILLFRRNLLRRLVSQLANDHDRRTKQLNGKHRAHVHSEHEANVLAMYKPTINTTELMSSLLYANECVSNALDYFKSTRHIVLYYEDLISNRTKLVDVLEFLRLPQRRLVSRHVKIHKKPLSKQVENWDDISSALKGTEYESFLNVDYRL